MPSNLMKTSFKTAAEKVLRASAEPLSAKEITERAMEGGWLDTQGATPEATMAAQLYVDLKKNSKTPFKKVGKGKFTLKERQESAASGELIVEKQNQLVRVELRKQLHAMDPYQFELLIGDLLGKLGYENVEVTKQSGDKGIDVVADLTLKGITDVKTVVQVKRYKEKNKLDGSVVTQLRGSAEVDQRGLIITLSDFTKGAIEESKAPNKMPVSLVNGEKLLDLFLEHEVGVKKELLPLYSIDSDWLEEFDNGAGEGDSKSNSQRRGLWPLPGGTDQYAKTLLLALDAIQKGANSRTKLSKWFLDTFDTVNSESTALGYAGVPRVLGMTQTNNGKISLTDAGMEFLKHENLEQLYGVIAINVFGVAEMMEFISSAGEAVSPAQIHEFFTENLNAEWESMHQVTFRLNWLVCLDKLEKTPEGFIAE